MKAEKLFYIKNGYVGNDILWWGHESKGYTTDIRKAGKYTKEKAKLIIKRPEDTAWPVDYIDKNETAHKMVIDGQYLDHKKSLKGRSR